MGKVLDKKDTESSASDEEREESGEESGKEWLAKFSTMKVGPPKGIRRATGRADSVENEPTSPQRPVRMVGEEAKKRLELYCEF